MLLVWVKLLRIDSSVGRGGWGVGEEEAEVVALDDLGHRSCFDVSDLDECRFERENVGIVQG